MFCSSLEGWRINVPAWLTPVEVGANAAIPIPMPKGVVMANRIESVGVSQLTFHDHGSLGELGEGEMSRQDVWEDADDNGVSELGSGDGSAGGREAIRIPRESPSKSWWNIMAVTRDAEK